jgi:hypothetical protein
MSTFYLVFEISALLAVIVLPLSAPKQVKVKKAAEKSNLYVNENGGLEYRIKSTDDHHPVL